MSADEMSEIAYELGLTSPGEPDCKDASKDKFAVVQKKTATVSVTVHMNATEKPQAKLCGLFILPRKAVPALGQRFSSTFSH